MITIFLLGHEVGHRDPRVGFDIKAGSCMNNETTYTDAMIKQRYRFPIGGRSGFVTARYRRTAIITKNPISERNSTPAIGMISLHRTAASVIGSSLAKVICKFAANNRKMSQIARCKTRQ